MLYHEEMVSKLGLAISRIMERIIPDPFVIAILLTLLTIVAAFLWGDFGDKTKFAGIIDSWSDGKTGMWMLLGFGMQMCLVLVTGYALATTSQIKKAINYMADIPSSTANAAALVGFVACVTGLLNWGLGLIVGALLAREVGLSMQRRQINCHYPLVVAAGFMGLLVWHGGLSGSAPLSMTTKDGVAKVISEQYLGNIDTVLLSESIGSSMNFIISGGLIILAPLMLFLLAPKESKSITPIDQFNIEHDSIEEDSSTPKSLPDWLNHSSIISYCIGGLLIIALGRHVMLNGVDRLGLNEITMFMLAIGILLHKSPLKYMDAVTKGAKGCAGIIIQFPLYAGIMAIMSASGLMAELTATFVEASSQNGAPLSTMVSAGIVNLFVPSGGGQWAIQGPIALESSMRLGIAPGTMVMAVAYGDQLTNMLQPFWALPLLAITGVRARDIVGYTAIIMIVSAIWIATGLLIFG